MRAWKLIQTNLQLANYKFKLLTRSISRLQKTKHPWRRVVWFQPKRMRKKDKLKQFLKKHKDFLR